MPLHRSRWQCCGWDAVKVRPLWKALDDCFGFVLAWMDDFASIVHECDNNREWGSMPVLLLCVRNRYVARRGARRSCVRHYKNRQKLPNKSLEVRLKNQTKTFKHHWISFSWTTLMSREQSWKWHNCWKWQRQIMDRANPDLAGWNYL